MSRGALEGPRVSYVPVDILRRPRELRIPGAQHCLALALQPRLTYAARLLLQHNVCGRSIYAQGTVDAVLFIAQQAKQRAAKTAYNMVDVISAEFVQ